MEDSLNTIRHGDCIAGMNALPAESVNLAFADPPFNIGYDYDVYHDRLESDRYVAWSRDWMAAVHRVLKPNGTFWLAIGDEYAAELKVEAQRLGFVCRSWVIWYYTFGVNCRQKFTRSHAHLFHFVKDRDNFVFRGDELQNRIPSARQLVYNDNRANPKGRLPDDTWIIRPEDAVGELTCGEETAYLRDEGRGTRDEESEVRGQTSETGRQQSPVVATAGSPLTTHHSPLTPDSDRTWTLRPQDLAHCFTPGEDTWYFPRVAGTFKERAGFHGCQMPEQLLGRIIRTCSADDAVVLDPFSGSGTTLAVAKKLGRKSIGFDLSAEYVRLGQQRLAAIRVGDPLDGSAEPLLSAPSTTKKRQSKQQRRKGRATAHRSDVVRVSPTQLDMTLKGVMTAFQAAHAGYSVDRLVADPTLNQQFVDACQGLGLFGDAKTWNTLLFRLRKGGAIAAIPTTKRTTISWEGCDAYLFASEIAWQRMLSEKLAGSLDEILCDPLLATTFDTTARQFAPGFTSLEYRWAALKLRKQAEIARSRGSVAPFPRLRRSVALDGFDPDEAEETPGVYLLSKDKTSKPESALYAGETLNLRERLKQLVKKRYRQVWKKASKKSDDLWIQVAQRPVQAEMLAWQSNLVGRYKPELNLRDLRATP